MKKPMTAVVLPTKEAKLAERERRSRELDEIEDELFAEHLRIIRASAAFRDVPQDADPTGPVPREFIDRADGDEAQARKDYRVAIASWLAPKDAPFAIQQSYRVVSGLSKVRHEERNAEKAVEAGRPLNISVYMGAPIPKGEAVIEADVLEVEK